jgi:chaperone required for assembly of F1-ATPase
VIAQGQTSQAVTWQAATESTNFLANKWGQQGQENIQLVLSLSFND